MKVQPKKYPARSIRETAEGKFWKTFTHPTVVPQVWRSGKGLSGLMCMSCGANGENKRKVVT